MELDPNKKRRKMKEVRFILAGWSTAVLALAATGQHQCQKIEALNEDCSWEFGGSVAGGASLIGGEGIDIDGSRAAVGAPGAAGGGAVYIFEATGLGGHWEQTAEINSPIAFGRFGEAVGLDAQTLIVGAPAASTGFGAAYIYEEISDVWTLVETLTEPGAIRFGQAVGLQGNTSVVGAPNTLGSGACLCVFPARCRRIMDAG